MMLARPVRSAGDAVLLIDENSESEMRRKSLVFNGSYRTPKSFFGNRPLIVPTGVSPFRIT